MVLDVNKSFNEDYFYWLVEIINPGNLRGRYDKVLRYLHSVRFTWTIPTDESREIDGRSLRERFIIEEGLDPIMSDIMSFDGCTVLEMMVALALRCENEIMESPEYPDRTDVWFWTMMDNMDISMPDGKFDEFWASRQVHIMLNREYEYDGSNGGLFVVPNPRGDLTRTDIWYQLMWYLTSLDE